MTTALAHNLDCEHLSQNPPLGKNRPNLKLVWENPNVSAGMHREKSEVRLRLVSGQSLYAYVLGNPVNFYDPRGLDVFTLHVGISIPFVGGITGGIMYDTGEGSSSGLPDVGIFSTLEKNHGGFGRGRISGGVSQTLGCRSNFDGTDGQLALGLGVVGGAVSGVGDGVSGNESLSLDIGPQFGLEGSVTHTSSFTVKDLINVFR